MGGANDFANSFGTSIGSGAINIRQAVLIAIISTFIGAILVGGHVTDTIRKGIVEPGSFTAEPALLILGLLAALVGAGLFLQAATHFGLPVSTTHAIVGSIIGFGVVALGFQAIRWGSLINIVLSWVLSPVGGAIVAYITFRIIRNRVLERKHPEHAAITMIPVFVGLTAGVVFLSMIYKGLKNLHLDLPLYYALPAAVVIGLIIGVITRLRMPALVGRPRRIQLVYVESRFKFLQIVTAGYVAFAHGANDVANGIGPLAGIWTIYKQGIVGLKADVPVWILALGATGIVLGLAIFGKRVIETIGKKITAITPSRGFSAEFAAATVVLVFSKLGMPVSTTHTLVGAIIGVGLARGIGAIDLRVVRSIFTSWIITIPASAAAAALAFAILRAAFGM